MLKNTRDIRRESGVTRRPEGLLAGMIGRLALIAFVAFFAACTPEPSNTSSDPVGEHRKSEKNEPVKGLSVTPPVAPVPQQAADSIWNGDYIEKYPNGLTKKRGYISGGLASGEWLTFYEDGKPWSRGYYHNGIRTGYGVSWYHDGQKSSEGYYNHGKQVGVWSYWSEFNHDLTVKDYGGEMPDTAATR